MSDYRIETKCVQGGYTPGNGEPRQIPIVQSTTFKYATSEDMGKLFDLEANGDFYTRLQNPTNDHVAAKICALEGGTAAMLTSSGQAASFYAIFNIVSCGEHVVCSSSIYGGTYNLFAVTMKRMGIDFTFVDPDCTEAELEAAFRQRPKALVLCNPSNPCGRVFTREELLTIAEMAAKYDTYVITDEVYEHIVYAPHRHTYFATLPGMWNRTLSCSSLSKTYSITGWRLGYIIAPEEIIDRAKKVHDFLTVGCAAPLQEAVIPGLEFGQDYYDDLLAKYTHKKDLFLKGLDELHISHNDPEGAYYVLLDISEYGYESDLQFCKNLAREVGVGAVPGSSFFREPVNHLIRLHFAKNDDTLNEALNRLEKIQKLKK